MDLDLPRADALSGEEIAASFAHEDGGNVSSGTVDE
jgi:hypothetical protein